MSERFRERLGYLSEELEGHLRSTSPAGSRSPRRVSRSPRPNNSDSPAIAVAIPLIRDSQPHIAAWPAPPSTPQLGCVSGNVRTLTSAPPPISPAALSPVSNSGSKHNDFDDPTTLLTMLKVAAATSHEPGPQIGRETELKKKIQTLEETVAEYERQKFNVMGTFSEYRERVAERERKLEAEYSSKIIALSEEVLGAKKDFEARMKSFQALQDKFEREKEQALEKLRQEHQKEIQLLEQRFSESQLLNLEQKYMIEIQRLEEERKSLRAEKERLGETFEMKLRRAQSLYETELTAAKMLYTKELEALRDHEEALKEELLARQDEFYDRLQELQHHAKRNRDELSNCKNEVVALDKKLRTKEAEVQSISKQLEEARTETSVSLKKLSKASTENGEFKNQYQEQEEELRKKSQLIAIAEAKNETLKARINDLQGEVKELKDKVDFLEKERENLLSQSDTQAQLQNSQVDALEAVLETVTKEKEATKEHYEGLLNKEKQQAEAREHAMKKEFSAKLNELEEQYTSLKEDLEHSARLDQDELRESTQQEISSLRTEKALLEAEIDALKQKFLSDANQEDLTVQLGDIVNKTSELTSQLEQYRERIRSKDEEVAGLRKRLEEEQSLSDQQLDSLRADLRQEMLNSDEYTGALHENEQLHGKIAEYEREKEKKGDAESAEVSDLKNQNEKLRKQLEEVQKSLKEVDDQSSVISDLKATLKEKEEEIQRLKQAETEDEDSKSELENLRFENASKTTKLEQLLSRVEELTEQMSSIKGELEQKTVELNQIKEKNDEFVRNLSKPLTSRETKAEQKEQEELIFSAKQNETALKAEIEDLRQRLSDMEQSVVNAEKVAEDSTAIESQRLEKEKMLSVKEEALFTLEEEMKQKETSIAAKEKTLKEKECELLQLKEEMKIDLDRREDTLNTKKSELDEQEKNLLEKPSTSCMDVQTDPVPAPAPVAIVDLAREKELKNHIEELEAAIQRKNQLIQKLQERIPDEMDEMVPKKKDRSQSVSSGGVFQNFVSQMKDKRDEANERSKKKEAERKAEKAAKEAAKEIAKEKSPMRSKSPSLLTRLRDRSPAKARTPNLETTPSSSNRNLLSPTEAERPMERRGSPSRALFGRKKDSKEAPYSPSDRRPAWKF